MWSAYTHCESQFKDAIQMALEQIDLIKRFTKMYDSLFNLCLSYDGKNTTVATSTSLMHFV